MSLTVVSTTLTVSASICSTGLHPLFEWSWLYNNPFSPRVRTTHLVPVFCKSSTALVPVSTSTTVSPVMISAYREGRGRKYQSNCVCNVNLCCLDLTIFTSVSFKQRMSALSKNSLSRSFIPGAVFRIVMTAFFFFFA